MKMENQIFNYQKRKILKYLYEILESNKDFYNISIGFSNITIQGYYKSKFVKQLKKKKFNGELNNEGYIYFKKVIAGVEVKFVLTD